MNYTASTNFQSNSTKHTDMLLIWLPLYSYSSGGLLRQNKATNHFLTKANVLTLMLDKAEALASSITEHMLIIGTIR